MNKYEFELNCRNKRKIAEKSRGYTYKSTLNNSIAKCPRVPNLDLNYCFDNSMFNKCTNFKTIIL